MFECIFGHKYKIIKECMGTCRNNHTSRRIKVLAQIKQCTRCNKQIGIITDGIDEEECNARYLQIQMAE